MQAVKMAWTMSPGVPWGTDSPVKIAARIRSTTAAVRNVAAIMPVTLSVLTGLAAADPLEDRADDVDTSDVPPASPGHLSDALADEHGATADRADTGPACFAGPRGELGGHVPIVPGAESGFCGPEPPGLGNQAALHRL